MKDEAPKKIALAILVFLGGVYLYVGLLLAPPRNEAARIRRDIERTQEQIRASGTELKTLRAKMADKSRQEELDARARALLDTIPSPYLVSTPAVLSTLFSQHELNGAKIGILLVMPLRELPDSTIARWTAAIADADAIQFGEALADLENRFPLGRLTELSLQVREGGGSVSASMMFDTVIHP